MRYITLGGNRYPIHCSVTVDEAVNKRFAAYRQKMVEQAEADVEARGLQGDAAEEYKAASLKSATLAYLTDAETYRDWETDRKSTRLNSSHSAKSRMPSSA